MKRWLALCLVCLLAGVAIAGEKIKGSFESITLDNQTITSWDNITGSGSTYDESDVNITGGTIDNTPIGGSITAAGNFTTLTAGAATFASLVVNENVILGGLFGGSIDNTIIGETTPELGFFTTLTAEYGNFDDLSIASGFTSGGTSTVSGLFYSESLWVNDNVLIGGGVSLSSTLAVSGLATFDNEIQAASFATTAADGEHFINVANSTAPTDNVTTGDCYYDNVALQWLCWNGSAWAGATGDVTGSSTTTFTNKTFDASSTGNILKQTKYLYLDTPSWASGTAATYDNTYHDVEFSGTAAKANNCAVYSTTVPDDLDNTVDIAARFKYELLGADTGAHLYVILMKSIADSSGVTGSYGELGNEISFGAKSDAAGAGADLETVGWKTLTNWATAVTPGHLWIIGVCRDGSNASDTSTVSSFSHSLTIRYGSVQ